MTITKNHHLLELAGRRPLEMNRTLVMGVLNVTPDSFSDGGRYLNPVLAVTRALKMAEEGADIIDIGGESTRPGSEKVTLETELKRTILVIEALRKSSAIPISIDTNKAAVARRALEAGADIINDISALRFDPDMAELAAKTAVPVILMHMLGTPETMQDEPRYSNCIAEIIDFFRERIEFCRKAGIKTERLILDPGIGFGKRLQDNLNILNNLDKFKILGQPLLVGASRKSFISMITGIKSHADKRIGGSLAAICWAIRAGCDIVRVHDVAETVEAIKVLNAIEESI
nr:dihydropteroate synthase [candidate division Zixibacteria bacterium]